MSKTCRGMNFDMKSNETQRVKAEAANDLMLELNEPIGVRVPTISYIKKTNRKDWSFYYMVGPEGLEPPTYPL